MKRKINTDICHDDLSEPITIDRTQSMSNRKKKKNITKDIGESDNTNEMTTRSSPKPGKDKKTKNKIKKDIDPEHKITFARLINRLDFNLLISRSVCVITIVIGVVLLWTFFGPKRGAAVIESFGWERTINIEKEVTTQRNDWFMPSSARLLYTQEEIRSYAQVVDYYVTKQETYYEQEIVGYEDVITENGVTKVPVYQEVQKTRDVEVPVYKEEPVYGTKYYYEIEVWTYDYSIVSSGTDHNPYWETVSLQPYQRESDREESYSINLKTSDGQIKTYQIDYEQWQSLHIGQSVTIKSQFIGNDELIYE